MNTAKIQLIIPAAKEFLVTARLVAASVSGRFGFHVDDVEDIKAACAEACILLMSYTKPGDEIWLEFLMADRVLSVDISAPKREAGKTETLESEFSYFLLEALVDELAFFERDDREKYTFKKQL